MLKTIMLKKYNFYITYKYYIKKIQMIVFIMAGGLGKRMDSGSDLPKVCHQVKCFIDNKFKKFKDDLREILKKKPNDAVAFMINEKKDEINIYSVNKNILRYDTRKTITYFIVQVFKVSTSINVL